MKSVNKFFNGLSLRGGSIIFIGLYIVYSLVKALPMWLTTLVTR
jgi:hypothetical protein